MAATKAFKTRQGLALACLVALGLSGCGTAPHTGPARHGQPEHPPSPGPRLDVVRVAAGQIGTAYRYGGNDRSGFDCSGLVQYAHRQIGVNVPRTTNAQWSAARTPDRRHLLPGDILFFDIGGKKSSHVGIYEGGGLFIHAPSSGREVGRASLDNPYWQRRLIGAKTFL